MGDRPAHHPLDAGLTEGGDPEGSEFQPGHHLLDVGRGEVEGEVPVDAFGAIGDGVSGFVGADDEPVVLAAVVARCPRVPSHGGLEVERSHRRDGFGDDVLMDHRDDRHVETHHRSQLRPVVAGGVHDVFGHDWTLLGHHLPAVIGEPAHSGDPVAEHDLGSELLGARCHGVGRRRRIGPTIPGRVEAELHIRHVQQWVQVDDLGGRDEMGFDAGQVEDSLHRSKPVDLVVVGSEPNCAAAMPAGVHPGLGFEFRVEIGSVGVDLGHVEAADEVRNQPRRMPGRTRRQLVLFDQDRVGPPLVGKVIEQPHTHRPATDDHTPGFRPHAQLLSRRQHTVLVSGTSQRLEGWVVAARCGLVHAPATVSARSG